MLGFHFSTSVSVWAASSFRGTSRSLGRARGSYSARCQVKSSPIYVYTILGLGHNQVFRNKLEKTGIDSASLRLESLIWTREESEALFGCNQAHKIIES